MQELHEGRKEAKDLFSKVFFLYFLLSLTDNNLAILYRKEKQMTPPEDGILSKERNMFLLSPVYWWFMICIESKL